MNLRECDRVGTNKKETSYRLRKYHAMVDEAMRDPVSLNMLKIDGKRIMEVTHETPGPNIGYMLYALFNEVIENIDLNTVEYLDNRATELMKLPENDLKSLSDKAKNKKEEVEESNIDEIRKKYHVS